jgi:hypothetical protein
VGTKQVQKLEQKMGSLKHEYDLFLAGNRRTEPLELRRQVEREVLMLSKSPIASTVFKFQVKTLSYRFRSFENQMRNLIERRDKRELITNKSVAAKTIAPVIIDDAVMKNPALINSRIEALVKAAGSKSGQKMKLSSKDLQEMMLDKARSVVGKNDVKAVMFSIVDSEKGPKVKGEVIGNKTKGKNEDS